MNYKQYELYWVDLNPVKWSEQSWIRPCVILQTNAVSDLWNTTIIAILTTKKLDRVYPYEILLEKNNDFWINELSKIKLDQIRVIDKSRILEKIWFIWDKNIQNNIIESIKIIFDVDKNF
jgi:mRNA interferase MazF